MSIAKKKSESSNVFNPIQNVLPPKAKKALEKEKETDNFEIHKNWNMSEEEKTIYGDRMIENYEKLDLLGK